MKKDIEIGTTIFDVLNCRNIIIEDIRNSSCSAWCRCEDWDEDIDSFEVMDTYYQWFTWNELRDKIRREN